MKKFALPVLIIFALSALLTGCGGGGSKSSSTVSPSASATRNATPTPAPTADPDDVRIPIGKMMVHFIDVGTGEAILIQTPNSKYVLIDGGGSDQGSRLSSYITGLGIKKIDTVIVSYPAEDRVGALSSVIDNFKIGTLYMPRIGADSAAFNTFLSSLGAKDIIPEYVKSGTSLQLDTDVALNIIAPVLSSYDFVIDYTIVAKLVYKNNSILLTGGATDVVESQISGQDAAALKADVLKVGNFGAFNTTTAAFLAAVSPKSAVIFGSSPDKEVVSRLTASNANIYRIDDGGTLTAECSGDKITFSRNPTVKSKGSAPSASPAT